MSESFLNLTAIGFCGVDDSVSPEHLALLSHHYSWVEWGVLFHPAKEGQPRYASTSWVTRLTGERSRRNSLMRLAAHLCGSRCQEVLTGDYRFVADLKSMGFNRVQINATAANDVVVNPVDIDDIVSNLRLCMKSVSDIEWIIQCNDETKVIWQRLTESPPANMSLLFDASCGLGVAIEHFPTPLAHIPCGYAGGIGPSTIEAILARVRHVAKGAIVWIDMESSLRSVVVNDSGGHDDVFSVEKAFSCMLIAISKFGLKETHLSIE